MKPSSMAGVAPIEGVWSWAIETAKETAKEIDGRVGAGENRLPHKLSPCRAFYAAEDGT